MLYLPLIDKAPAEHSTMMTTMVKSQKIAEKVGQQYVVFTADQKMYRVALHVNWENQTQLSNTHMLFGGIHILMTYCGSEGTLMAGTGTQEILSTAFGGVMKMLTGKNYTRSVRVFRMLVEVLLRPILAKHHPECMEDLQEALDDIAAQSRTSKLWVDCLIKPVFTILKYKRAERESD